jgi:toxin YoeB
MKIAWTEDAWHDTLHWQHSDEKILASINELIKDIKRNPFKGSANRSPLNTRCKAGSRAESQANTVRSIAFPAVEIVQCRYHY